MYNFASIAFTLVTRNAARHERFPRTSTLSPFPMTSTKPLGSYQKKSTTTPRAPPDCGVHGRTNLGARRGCQRAQVKNTKLLDAKLNTKTTAVLIWTSQGYTKSAHNEDTTGAPNLYRYWTLEGSKEAAGEQQRGTGEATRAR
jgi:hypothetical protein